MRCLGPLGSTRGMVEATEVAGMADGTGGGPGCATATRRGLPMILHSRCSTVMIFFYKIWRKKNVKLLKNLRLFWLKINTYIHTYTFARALTKPVPCYWAMVLDLEAFGFKQTKILFGYGFLG